MSLIAVAQLIVRNLDADFERRDDLPRELDLR